MLRPLLIAALVPVLTGCAAFAQTEDLGNRSPAEIALINATCHRVMGLHDGEEFYQDCQDSLAHMLARRDAAYAMAAGESTCLAEGLKPGSAALATCTLDRRSEAAGAPALQPVALSQSIEPGRSYYSVTPSVQFQRKRYACAQLGLMPGSGLFGECVANLEGSLQPYSG